MFRIDRFMVYYQKSSFLGMNPANPESPKENCIPYDHSGSIYLSNPIDDVTIQSNQTRIFTIPSNTFAGGTAINYASYLSNMQQLSFDPKTHTFTANPRFLDGGKYTVLIKGEDNGTYAVDAFNLTVIGNTPPIMAITLKDTIANTGQEFIYDIASHFHDADNHELNIIVRSGTGLIPAWLTFHGSVLTGNPSVEDIGNDTIYITASDDFGGSILESFIIKCKIFSGWKS